MAYSQYIPTNERPVISALLTAALEGGNTISIYDGCEFVLKRSTSINDIRTALGGAEEDEIIIRDSDGAKIGWFYLIYNNGSEGDPMIVIADYTANAYCEALYSPISDKYS